MSKFNPKFNHLFRRGLFDPSRVCEQPLNEPCNANKTRIGCVLQDCCFFMDACYKKTVPGYLKAFYSLIPILLILFWGVLGFWAYKYRRQKKKLADMNGVKENPAEIDIIGVPEEQEEHAGTSQVEEYDETAVVGANSTSEIETKQDDVKGVEENISETAVVVTVNTSKMEEKYDDVKGTEENNGKTGHNDTPPSAQEGTQIVTLIQLQGAQGTGSQSTPDQQKTGI